MKSIIANTIEKIKKDNIRPQPRWKYLAKKYSVWVSFFAAAFFGAITFSVAYFIVSQLDWDLYATAHRFSFMYYLSLIPYLWIILIAILALLTFLALRNTERGYRYNFSKMTLAVLGSIIVFGILSVFVGFGGKINASMMHNFPGYGRLVTTKEVQWSQPEKGLLAGTISSVSENSFDLRDLLGKEWQIDINEKTLVRPSVNLESGEMIKTIGQEKNGQNFQASEIRPWQGKGQGKRGEDARSGNANNAGGRKK